ncbi:MAG: OmpH family outer membrane protein, partial [Rikenellaceae bacterium]
MMKKVFKIALVALLAVTATATYAQKQGRINVQTVVMAMPETKTMQTNLEAFRKDLSDNLETMQVEFNNKYTDYQSTQAT